MGAYRTRGGELLLSGSGVALTLRFALTFSPLLLLLSSFFSFFLLLLLLLGSFWIVCHARVRESAHLPSSLPFFSSSSFLPLPSLGFLRLCLFSPFFIAIAVLGSLWVSLGRLASLFPELGFFVLCVLGPLSSSPVSVIAIFCCWVDDSLVVFVGWTCTPTCVGVWKGGDVGLYIQCGGGGGGGCGVPLL